MGLLQKAVETYDANAAAVGAYREGSEPLAPIGHTLTNASIEITLDRDGNFLTARKVDKTEPKILIPVTEESGGRTSKGAKEHPHPLCDKIKYIIANDNFYIPQLERWCNSANSHPFLATILRYVKTKKLVSDLEKSVGSVKDDDVVCWRINGYDGEEPACWKNRALFEAYINYYTRTIAARGPALCMISGDNTTLAIQHSKGIIPVNGNAKLISANDSSGFTFRGRLLRLSNFWMGL